MRFPPCLAAATAVSFWSVTAAHARPPSPPSTVEPLWTELAHRPADGAPGAPTFARLARTLGAAVVNISTIQSEDRELGGRGGGGGRSHTHGQGTGFLIHRHGYLVTNQHVVAGAEDITVRLSDEREFTGHLVGADARTDIALLKIDAPEDLPVAPLGDSDRIEIGEWVLAIGNPFGLDHTVTVGIVSGKGRRDVRPGGGTSGFFDFIQTDASINAGNSGGPLINAHGEVIGVNTAINSNGQGIAFAIPINMVKTIAPTLRARGRAPRAWLGLQTQSVTVPLERAFGLSDLRGALVAEVAPGSPAERAGFLAGDLVVDFDGRPIRRSDDLEWLVATAGEGRRVMVTVRRAGAPLKLVTTLLLDPGDAGEPPARPPERGRGTPLGMAVSEVTPSMAREMGLHDGVATGVVVVQVEAGSPASEAGVERGDLVLRIADAAIRTLDDYAGAVRGIKAGEMIRMLARRSGRSVWMAFEKR